VVAAGGEVAAHPRPTPLLVPRGTRGSAALLRADTDAASADVPRLDHPLPLRAIVVLERVRVHSEPLSVVRGREKLTVALGLPVAGVLGRDGLTAAARFAEARVLSELPILRVVLDAGTAVPDETLAGLTGWWASASGATP
ncbi:MAG: hypothetical protein JWO76_833, partial [Nocardioides sp.]|nr:hypothetical protein [Nocardioides sp.]